MNSIKTLLAALRGGGPGRVPARTRPGCETLEGRRLLTAASGAVVAVPAGTHPAEKGAPAVAHAPEMPTLSAAALADLKAIEADTQALQNEIKAKVPASLTAALKKDEASFRLALDSVARDWTGPHGGRGGFDEGTDPSVDVFRVRPRAVGADPGTNLPVTGEALPAPLAAKLRAGGVSDSLIAQFKTDARAFQTAVQQVDPKLLARIQSERQAFQKDAPPPAAHFDHIVAPANKVG